MALDPPGQEPQLEPAKTVGIDITGFLLSLKPEQLAHLDIAALIERQNQVLKDARADEQQMRRERRLDIARTLLIGAVLGLIALEFLIGAAVFVWADDENWDELKDLLAYGLAPLAALAGAAGAYYFAPPSK